jgi:hypothetical protein
MSQTKLIKQHSQQQQQHQHQQLTSKLVAFILSTLRHASLTVRWDMEQQL